MGHLISEPFGDLCILPAAFMARSRVHLGGGGGATGTCLLVFNSLMSNHSFFPHLLLQPRSQRLYF